jgi:beta-mannosidase
MHCIQILVSRVISLAYTLYLHNADAYSDDATTAFDMNSYPIGRFADEFGLISMPSLESWREVIPEDQLSFDSEQVLHRNRHYPFGASGSDDDLSRAGIAVMTKGVQLWYPQPAKTDPVANFR